MIKNLTDKDFKKETAKGVVLTDFWATWCPPCRMQGPIVEQLNQEMGDQVKITKMDVDQNQQTVADFDIMSIPTLIIKKDGKVVDKLVGLHSKDQLKTALQPYLN